METNNVLITGGTGLIGEALTNLLLEKGYKVAYLSRTAGEKNGIISFKWDLHNSYIDEKAIEWADYIIHLAGTSVANKRWSDDRKKEIIFSRTKGVELIANILLSKNYKLKAFISSSGIAYYGIDTKDKWVDEDSEKGDGFLADVVEKWEEVIYQISNLGIRCAALRTGVVLSNKGGALSQLAAPVKLGFGAALGSGEQFLPWIHIEDLCKQFLFVIENQHIEGILNAVAPNPLNNKDFTKVVAQVLHKPLWLPNAPGFVLRIVLGEMADIVLGGNRVKPKRFVEEGFIFHYPELKPALKQLFKKG